MHCKKTGFSSGKRQLNSTSINDEDVVVVNKTTNNKIVNIFSKLEKNNSKKESDNRKESINRLLNYAEELDW